MIGMTTRVSSPCQWQNTKCRENLLKSEERAPTDISAVQTFMRDIRGSSHRSCGSTWLSSTVTVSEVAARMPAKRASTRPVREPCRNNRVLGSVATYLRKSQKINDDKRISAQSINDLNFTWLTRQAQLPGEVRHSRRQPI